MKKTFLNVMICLLWLIFCTSCNNGTNKIVSLQNEPEIKQKNINKLNYDSIVRVIDSKVVDLTSPSDLFSISEFVDIYESSSFYLDSMESFLIKSDVTAQQKIISIYSMQNLDLSRYLVLCNNAIDLFRSGKISEQILESVINPNFANKYPIVKNFQKIEVVNILEKLRYNKTLSPEFSAIIKDISTGKAWKDITAFKESEGIN